jgi:hypothetical protein
LLDHVHGQAIAIDRNEVKCNAVGFALGSDITCRWLTEVFRVRAITDNCREATGRNVRHIRWAYL